MIYAHDEPSHWGRAVVMAAGRAGLEARLFRTVEEVPPGAVAFVRLDQRKERRDKSKMLVTALHKRGVHVLPNAQDAKLYDDKYFQYETLKDFMPETFVAFDQNKATKALSKLTFPLVSKSFEGASSFNVRLLQTRKDAEHEIRLVWGGGGIPMSYGRRQMNYVYWQRFVPGNPNDYRVVMVGEYGWGLIRSNRPDVPFASGSGVNQPLTLTTDRERKAYEFAWKVRDHLNTDLLGVDIVFDGDEPVLLETTSSWSAGLWTAGPVFDRAGNGTQYRLGHQFDLIVLVLQRMMGAVNASTAA